MRIYCCISSHLARFDWLAMADGFFFVLSCFRHSNAFVYLIISSRRGPNTNQMLYLIFDMLMLICTGRFGRSVGRSVVFSCCVSPNFYLIFGMWLCIQISWAANLYIPRKTLSTHTNEPTHHFSNDMNEKYWLRIESSDPKFCRNIFLNVDRQTEFKEI